MKISKQKYAALMRVLRNLPARLYEECRYTLRERNAVREAQMRQTDIFSYKPYCAAAIDYRNLVKEVLDDG